MTPYAAMADELQKIAEAEEQDRSKGKIVGGGLLAGGEELIRRGLKRPKEQGQ